MFKAIVNSVSHLLFPHLCNGCGSDLLDDKHLLCTKCYDHLYKTNFELLPDNTVEKTLWGRLACSAATSQYYFSKGSVLQHLVHQFKYKSNKDIAVYLGKCMGETLREANRFNAIDAIIPLPLFPDKQRKRGYNQAALLCEGIASVMQIPVIYNVVHRIRYTETQTHKTRMERWQNVEGVFITKEQSIVQNKNLLLVDDVITTGATIEACGNAILEDIPGVKLNIAALAYANA
ncbi:MAG: ComF family protein [Terrimonas sp.]|nr:ComF family protein [Terrimonas sp.]OJY87764.1 MAG: phosphoribosyltransferase [Sphingobacteriales bacterium 40-81]